MSNKHSLLTKSLKELTYSDIENLKKYMRSPEFKKRENILWEEKCKLDRIEYEKNRKRREEQKKIDADLNKYVVAFVENYVNEGDFVGFNGTRSYPLRQVAQIRNSEIFGMIVRKLTKKDGEIVPTFTGYSSSNGISKLRSWYDKENESWVKRPEMIEEGKKLLSKSN